MRKLIAGSVLGLGLLAAGCNLTAEAEPTTHYDQFVVKSVESDGFINAYNIQGGGDGLFLQKSDLSEDVQPGDELIARYDVHPDGELDFIWATKVPEGVGKQ